MITSEPGIRAFDGYEFSDNLALDGEGVGRIQNDLQTFQAAVAAGYDQLLGYIFWASDQIPDE